MNDSMATTDNGIDGLGDLDCKPRYNMQFDSEQVAYDFYNEYGRRVGFSIRRDSHGKNKQTGELTSRIFVCCKEGYRCNDKRDHLIKNPRADTRTGCGARMGIKLNRRDGKFMVNHFVEMHNHPFVIQECTHMLPSQRKMSDSQATEVDLVEESGIPLSSSYELMGRQAGGRESLGYTKQDQKNYLRTKRQRKLAYGEAGSVLQYFQNQTVDNPSFFYAVQLDSDELITNMFWADAQMIIDYSQFGDVVSFDTTYKINKENRPFAVFVGFNHHRETVIFGAALMYDETADSFIWLLKTFLEAMSNKAPKTIFTDQDAAMAKAISYVMPDTYHRLCTWHIMQNALKHVNSVFTGPGGVKSVLSKFMNYYEEEDDFLAAWDAMLNEYNVRENSWLKIIFGLREKWAMAYVKWAWSAGMKSTQLSESFNARLKDYLKSDHDVVQFFMHFERILNDKRYKELEAEYALCYKLPMVKVPVQIMHHAANTYTKAIFDEFQEQYFASLELFVDHSVEDGGNFVYTITKNDHSRERLVRRERDNTISCSCRLFEMRGILCGHALKVLRDVMRILEIPNQYILKRWTRKARVDRAQDMHGRVIEVDTRLQQTHRYRALCSMFTRISSRASESQETYEVTMRRGNELHDIIEGMLNLQLDGQANDTKVDCLENENVVQAKGLKKKEATHKGRRRIKSNLEKSLAKKKKSSNPHSLQDTSILTNTDSMDVYSPCPPPPSQSSQGGNVPNSVSWMPYGVPQHTSFQALLQHNTTGFPFAFQDSHHGSSDLFCTEHSE